MSTELVTLAERLIAAPYVARLGVQVASIEAERLQLRLPYKDENSNPGRALHGGVAASLIDIAGGLVSRAALGGGPDVEAGTLDLSVDYLAAAIGEDIIAAAEVLRRGKELVYSMVDVRNEAGKRIAAGLVTYRLFDPSTASGAGARQRALAPETAPARELIRGATAFVSVPFIAGLGVDVVHAAEGEATVRMPFAAGNADHGEVVHEGALAALLDTTGALASWSITGLNFAYKASTVGIHVNYHAPARHEAVVAYARTLRRNNEIFLNQVTVSGAQSQRIVATGTVTYRIVVPDDEG